MIMGCAASSGSVDQVLSVERRNSEKVPNIKQQLQQNKNSVHTGRFSENAENAGCESKKEILLDLNEKIALEKHDISIVKDASIPTGTCNDMILHSNDANVSFHEKEKDISLACTDKNSIVKLNSEPISNKQTSISSNTLITTHDSIQHDNVTLKNITCSQQDIPSSSSNLVEDTRHNNLSHQGESSMSSMEQEKFQVTSPSIDFPQVETDVSSPDETENEIASAQLYSENENDVKLHSFMRLLCDATDSMQLYEVIGNTGALYLHRSMAFTSELRDILVNIVARMSMLRKLDVSSNNAGPVASRALLVSLQKYDNVQYLDLSDNMCDVNGAQLVADYVASTSKLQFLNLSGNLLGKESLSKTLSTAMQVNHSLVELNISECGATNLHGLFEGIRIAASNDVSSLKVLDISNNHIADGQQLGIDLSLLLENEKCHLEKLFINDVGLTSSGWEALLSALRVNSDLCELEAGGSTNQMKNVIFIAEVILSNRLLSRLHLGSTCMEEHLRSDDINLNFQGVFPDNLNLLDLDLHNCSLTDGFFTQLSLIIPGKFNALESLNISSNCDLTEIGLNAVKQLCTLHDTVKVKTISFCALGLDYLPVYLKESFASVLHLILRKSRISANALSQLCSIPQSLHTLVLDGIKISGTGVLASLCGIESRHHFIKLGLSGCSLIDEDLKPLITALGRTTPPLNNLVNLNLSVNRLTHSSVVEMCNSLLSTKNHPFETIDLSNNLIEDSGAVAMAKFVMSSSCLSNLKRVLLPFNELTSYGISPLMDAMASTSSGKGLHSLDVSNQKSSIGEEELDAIIESLATSVGMDADTLTENDTKQPFPLLSPKFTVNLSKLGGSIGLKGRSIDSIAIKTDFSNLRYPSATLNDYLLIAEGLMKNTVSSTGGEGVTFTVKEWQAIVGVDAPAWLKVAKERQKGIYLNHLPGTTTIQRLEGVLEMEADCEVSDIYLIKDPILHKPTGAAWILFADEASVDRSMEWFASGGAQMYGTPFTISSLLVSVDDEGGSVEAIAKRELAAREKQRQEGDEADRAMLEASQQIADERAAYRETHPAYQNGRIW